MRRRLAITVFGLALAASFSVGMIFIGSSAVAQSQSENTGTFVWLIGMAPLPGGPAVSFAADGSSIEMSGLGLFSIGENGPPFITTIFGSYQTFDAANNPGPLKTWRMTRMEGYVDYGGITGPGGEDLRGGTLHAEVVLDGLGMGHITVDCQISVPPPENLVDGVQVRIGSLHFDDSTGAPATTVFVGCPQSPFC